MQNNNLKNLTGINISKLNSYIDFEKIKKRNIDIVYIKATEGHVYIDPCFEINALNANKSSLLVGFYHVFRPSTEELAFEQARHFVNTIKNYPCDCKVALNIENASNLTSSKITTLCNIFLNEIKNLSNLDGVIYTTTNFIERNLKKSLSMYPLWVIQETNRSFIDNGIWDNWIGYQYFDKKVIDGLTGHAYLSDFTSEIFLS